MKDEILLEMMASIMQEMYDEGYGAEFRPAMQNVLVAFNNRELTKRAVDLATDSHCPECNSRLTWCAECNKYVTPSH